ncbi:MAG TPA: tetratricopeptide repeat protein [bacterium]|nr:tetratricopeptide repeat protein [bacterium]
MRRSALSAAILSCAALFMLCGSAFGSEWESEAKACRELSGQVSLDACNSALASMPEDLPDEFVAEIHRNRGIAYGQMGRKEEALHELKLAAKLFPNDAKTQYNLGVAYEEMGKEWFALRAYRKAVHLDPQMTLAWGNLGMAAYHTERYVEARAAFDTAQQVDPFYFDTRPEQEQAWSESMKKAPVSTAAGHEVNLRFTPSAAALLGIDSSVSSFINPYSALFFDTELDVQIYKRLFGAASFLYGHTFSKTGPTGSSLSSDIYGVGLGLKLVSRDKITDPFVTFLDRSRFWAMAQVGPYISSGSVTLTSAGTTSTKTSFGANVGVGFEYYFIPNFAMGLSVKAHFVNMDIDQYFMMTGGPTFVGRF